jgi:nitrate/nitrite-specific signal transduction histidine kinase
LRATPGRAGRGSSFDLSPHAARLIVGDDGLGFDEAATGPSHMGLKTMRERAEEAGAEFSVTTKTGEGAVVVVQWFAADPAGGSPDAARSVK